MTPFILLNKNVYGSGMKMNFSLIPRVAWHQRVFYFYKTHRRNATGRKARKETRLRPKDQIKRATILHYPPALCLDGVG